MLESITTPALPHVSKEDRGSNLLTGAASVAAGFTAGGKILRGNYMEGSWQDKSLVSALRRDASN